MLVVEQVRVIASVVMDVKGCLFVCLFWIVLIGHGALGQGHGSLCRPNERFLSCGGCQKTCRDPFPECKAVCRTGCYCNDDEVRNDTGHCVKLAECPSLGTTDLTTEPRTSGQDCPPDEEYRSCEPCNRTCENPNPICPAQCARGCFCREDLVRDKNGTCVKLEKCSNVKKMESYNFIKPNGFHLTCGEHQVYNDCKACERTCSSPTPICRPYCSAGCFCEEGYLKAPSGQCVRQEECPKAEVTIGGAHEPSIEDCSSDEIYLSCGWCEPSCWEPRPECPRGVCTRGCLCRPPLLRHHSGHCVAEQDCRPQKCSSPNEEFVCRYGCEARCNSQKCISRPRRCVLGCHCKLGLLRDVTGQCVTPDKCHKISGSIASPTLEMNITDPFSELFYKSNQSEVMKRNINTGVPLNLLNKGNGQVFINNVTIPPSLLFTLPTTKLTRTTDIPVIDKINKVNSHLREDFSRTVKMYKQWINEPLNLYKDIYVPRSNKDLSHKDSFKPVETMKTKPANAGPRRKDLAKNYMSNLLQVMKQMAPQPQPFNLMNFTLNYSV